MLIFSTVAYWNEAKNSINEDNVDLCEQGTGVAQSADNMKVPYSYLTPIQATL